MRADIAMSLSLFQFKDISSAACLADDLPLAFYNKNKGTHAEIIMGFFCKCQGQLIMNIIMKVILTAPNI